MRQLSAPGRTAVWIVTSLAALASAGCMSVSDDAGGKPAPSTSAEQRGTVAEPDGGQMVPGGHGRRQADGDETSSEAPDDKNTSASPGPSGSGSAHAEPTPTGHRPPTTEPPAPTGGGASPSASESSEPPPQESSKPPTGSPSPTPTEPTAPPSASSESDVQGDGTRAAAPAGTRTEPAASPWSHPYGAERTVA